MTDIDTGEPIVGVTVEASPHDSAYVRAVTDGQGLYELAGVPKKKRHHLEALPPANEPYFKRRLMVTEVGEGLEPTQLNIQLKRGKWIQGRVTNKVTGAPEKANVFFRPYLDNPVAEEYPSMVKGVMTHLDGTVGVRTDDDGSFRVPAISGRGILAAVASQPGYCVGIGRDKLASDRFGSEGNQFVNTYDPIQQTPSTSCRKSTCPSKATSIRRICSWTLASSFHFN